MPWHDDLAPVLDTGLLEGSLSKTLEARGQSPASGEQWANVLPALCLEDAVVMGRQPGEPMLWLKRLTRCEDGGICEYVESLLDPDLFGLHMEF